jgi:hypothetical protein
MLPTSLARRSIPPSLKAFIGQPLLGRHRTLPTDIFRIQTGPTTTLREYESQMRLGKSVYDLHLHSDGLVHPAEGAYFQGILNNIF